MTIAQSPGLLASERKKGTTGAGEKQWRLKQLGYNLSPQLVVWRTTPLIAEWLASPQNPLFKHHILDSSSIMLELGCGVSGILALTVAPRIGRYVCTDQEYVFKVLKANLENNHTDSRPPNIKSLPHIQKKRMQENVTTRSHNIDVLPLDWETHSVSSLAAFLNLSCGNDLCSLDVVIACDCIYNDALLDPFIDTCVNLCRLSTRVPGQKPTLCVVAQQLRSPEVFEAWMVSFCRHFKVWRVPDDMLGETLKSHSGFVIHVGLLHEVSI